MNDCDPYYDRGYNSISTDCKTRSMHPCNFVTEATEVLCTEFPAIFAQGIRQPCLPTIGRLDWTRE